MRYTNRQGGFMLTEEQIISVLEDRNLVKVARALGCSRATLSGYMRGEFRPSDEIIKKLSDYIEGGTK